MGQICNAALDRSIIAYNENSDAEERRRFQEETEVLSILTGLEIDSAKSGIRPNLDEYLKERRVERTSFLQYKNLVEESEDTRHAWYEQTHQQRIKAFFQKIDWGKVDSNLKRLPHLALQLGKHTPANKSKPAKDSELITFAQEPDWKEHLDQAVLEQVSALLTDYEKCLHRIRICRLEPKEKKRKSDIERILFAGGRRSLGTRTSCTPSWEACRRSGWRRYGRRWRMPSGSFYRKSRECSFSSPGCWSLSTSLTCSPISAAADTGS